MDFVCPCFRRVVQDSCLRFPGGQEGWFPLASRPVGVPSCPAPPRPATPPCAALPRPARGMYGFWIRQVGPRKVIALASNRQTLQSRLCPHLVHQLAREGGLPQEGEVAPPLLLPCNLMLNLLHRIYRHWDKFAGANLCLRSRQAMRQLSSGSKCIQRCLFLHKKTLGCHAKLITGRTQNLDIPRAVRGGAGHGGVGRGGSAARQCGAPRA